MSRIAEMTTSAVTNRDKGGQIKRGGKERTHGHKEECYYKHYCTARDLDKYRDHEDYGPWTAFGWIITKGGIEDMKREEKKNAEKAAKERAEFPECVYLD